MNEIQKWKKDKPKPYVILRDCFLVYYRTKIIKVSSSTSSYTLTFVAYSDTCKFSPWCRQTPYWNSTDIKEENELEIHHKLTQLTVEEFVMENRPDFDSILTSTF